MSSNGDSKLKTIEDKMGGITLGQEMGNILSTKNGVEQHAESLAKYALNMMYNSCEKSIGEKLTNTVRNLDPFFNNMVIKPYGSRFQGLRLKGYSDMDVFVGSNELFRNTPTANMFPSDKLKDEMADRLVMAMKKDGVTFSNIEKKMNVKCVYEKQGLECDFSFRGGIGYRNSLLIRKMLDLDDRARPMILFLKEWSELNGIRFYFTGYLATLLVFQFLADLKILPPASIWQENAPSYKIGVHETGMVEKLTTWKKNEQMAAKSVAELLAEFFVYFSVKSYDAIAIFPQIGQIYTRDSFLKNYKSVAENLTAKEVDEHYGTHVRISVAGFGDYSNAADRLGDKDSKAAFESWKELLKKSADITKKWHSA